MGLVSKIQDKLVEKKVGQYANKIAMDIENDQFNKIAKSVIRFEGDDRYIFTYQMLYNILKIIASDTPENKRKLLTIMGGKELPEDLSGVTVFNTDEKDSYKTKCIDRAIAANINSIDFDSINETISIVYSLDSESADRVAKSLDKNFEEIKNLTIIDKITILKANALRNMNNEMTK